MILNGKYRELAKTLTERENHKYQSTYDSSLIIKRFVFEFYDCFLPLIYFGWWELDFAMLRSSVIMLFAIDEIRRVLTESLLPYLSQNKDKIKENMKNLSVQMRKKDALKKVENAQKNEKGDKVMDQNKKELIIIEELEELDKEDMEIFDDFIEMIITFGYITMFGCCFVLSAPILFVFIMIESRSDIFKLEKTLRRPLPVKTNHIGSWAVCMQLFCFLSIFSNIIVSCYASN